MKKISVMLLAALMLFAFVACEENPNDENVIEPIFTNDFSGTAAELKEVFGANANMKDDGVATNGGAYLKLEKDIDLTKGYNVSYTFDLEDSITKTVGFNTSAHYNDTYINAFVEFAKEGEVIKASLRSKSEGNLTQASPLSDMTIDTAQDVTVSIDVKETASGTVEMTGTVTNGSKSQSIGTITCSTELASSKDLVWTIYYGTGMEGNGTATILTMKDLTITPLA